MPVHEEVLRTARRLCRERGEWSFTPAEVVRALPHLNESTVRTHIVSRCCVNAPKNHPHKWPYFRRIGRGRYVIEPRYWGADRATRSPSLRRGGQPAEGLSRTVAETREGYRIATGGQRNVIHAVVRSEDRVYTAECLEIAVVTQGRTVDEVIGNLREAIALHLEGEDLTPIGLSPTRVAISYEIPLPLSAAES